MESNTYEGFPKVTKCALTGSTFGQLVRVKKLNPNLGGARTALIPETGQPEVSNGTIDNCTNPNINLQPNGQDESLIYYNLDLGKYTMNEEESGYNKKMTIG